MNRFFPVIEQIATEFGTTRERVVITPVRHANVERNNVWRLTINGQNYLLKQHFVTQPIGESNFTPFEIEAGVLKTLYHAGCHVPQLVWKSNGERCLLLAWCGTLTLDQLAQENPVKGLQTVIHNTVHEFCKIDRKFTEHAHAITPYIHPTPPTHTLEVVLRQARKTIDYLVTSSDTSRHGPSLASFETAWANLSNSLKRASTTLGCLDYNARNILVDGDTPTFIDFASVGWDWPEKRLVQSLNSLGAHRREGNFVNLLDSEIVEHYSHEIQAGRKGVSKSQVAAHVDYHHIVFYLVAIYRLLKAIAQPEANESQLLLKAWDSPKTRFHQAVTILAESRLSGDPHAIQIREFVAHCQG